MMEVKSGLLSGEIARSGQLRCPLGTSQIYLGVPWVLPRHTFFPFRYFDSTYLNDPHSTEFPVIARSSALLSWQSPSLGECGLNDDGDSHTTSFRWLGMTRYLEVQSLIRPPGTTTVSCQLSIRPAGTAGPAGEWGFTFWGKSFILALYSTKKKRRADHDGLYDAV